MNCDFAVEIHNFFVQRGILAAHLLHKLLKLLLLAVYAIKQGRDHVLLLIHLRLQVDLILDQLLVLVLQQQQVVVLHLHEIIPIILMLQEIRAKYLDLLILELEQLFRSHELAIQGLNARILLLLLKCRH